MDDESIDSDRKNSSIHSCKYFVACVSDYSWSPVTMIRSIHLPNICDTNCLNSKLTIGSLVLLILINKTRVM
ncbi:hypothetical protein V1478_002075, partial [Vespula squamosa]